MSHHLNVLGANSPRPNQGLLVQVHQGYPVVVVVILGADLVPMVVLGAVVMVVVGSYGHLLEMMMLIVGFVLG